MTTISVPFTPIRFHIGKPRSAMGVTMGSWYRLTENGPYRYGLAASDASGIVAPALRKITKLWGISYKLYFFGFMAQVPLERSTMEDPPRD